MDNMEILTVYRTPLGRSMETMKASSSSSPSVAFAAGTCTLFVLGLMLSACIMPSGPGGDSDGRTEGQESWRQAQRVVFDISAFPEDAEWLLIEATGKMSRMPVLTMEADWVEHEADVQDAWGVGESQRRSCMAVWTGSEEQAEKDHMYGWGAYGPEGFSMDMAGVQRSGDVNRGTIHYAFSQIPFGGHNVSEGASSFFLFGINLIRNPLPEDVFRWVLESETEFRWRLRASGSFHCGFSAGDFAKGEYVSMRAGSSDVQRADGLRETVSIREAGLVALGVTADVSFHAFMDADGTRAWEYRHNDPAGGLETQMVARWSPTPSWSTLGVDGLVSRTAPSGPSFMVIDGVPSEAAQAFLLDEPDASAGPPGNQS